MSGSGFDWEKYRREREDAIWNKYCQNDAVGEELERSIKEYARQIIAFRASLVRYERVAHQVKAMIRAAGAKPWGEK